MNRIIVLVSFLLISCSGYSAPTEYGEINKPLSLYRLEQDLFDKHNQLYFTALKTKDAVDIQKYEEFADSVLLLIKKLDILTQGLEVNREIKNFDDRYYAQVMIGKREMDRSGLRCEEYYKWSGIDTIPTNTCTKCNKKPYYKKLSVQYEGANEIAYISARGKQND